MVVKYWVVHRTIWKERLLFYPNPNSKHLQANRDQQLSEITRD